MEMGTATSPVLLVNEKVLCFLFTGADGRRLECAHGRRHSARLHSSHHHGECWDVAICYSCQLLIVGRWEAVWGAVGGSPRASPS